ncbi:MAG: adenosine kinase [Bacteroidales bacterium]
MTKVLGIGNALVDIMTKLPDDKFLEEYNLPKGSMQLVDQDFIKKISAASEKFEKIQSSGGSASNTIHGVARLGLGAGFIGKVGEDELGDFFYNDMKSSNIDPKLLRTQTDSGRAVALISPDSERTFATFLGAAVELSPDELKSEFFQDFDYLHVEGYLVQNHDLLEKASKLAKDNGLKICLDLASYNVVEDNIDFLKSFINDYVDIIFANEEEAKSFTGKEPEDALEILSKQCEIAIVKVGKDGSIIKKGNEKHVIKPIQANPVDTTGAGDAYAAGFLYGLAKEYNLDKCGEIGSILAGKVIEVVGAKMDEKKWQEIYDLVK